MLSIKLVPYVSPSYSNEQNGGNDLPTLLLAQNYKFCPEKSKNCDTCQHTKWSIIKCGKLRANEAEEITLNKLCVDIMGTYDIQRKGKKVNLNI